MLWECSDVISRDSPEPLSTTAFLQSTSLPLVHNPNNLSTVTPLLPNVTVIVPDDAVGRQVFSGTSRFSPRHNILTLLHTHLPSTSTTPLTVSNADDCARTVLTSPRRQHVTFLAVLVQPAVRADLPLGRRVTIRLTSIIGRSRCLHAAACHSRQPGKLSIAYWIARRCAVRGRETPTRRQSSTEFPIIFCSVFTIPRRNLLDKSVSWLLENPKTASDPGSTPGRVTPSFRMWESCRTMPLVGRFSRGYPVSPALSFWRCYILIPITLIGTQDLDFESFPNLFTHSFLCTPSIAERLIYQLGSPLVDDLPIMKAVKYRVVSGVVWTNRTMVSSRHQQNRTETLAASTPVSLTFAASEPQRAVTAADERGCQRPWRTRQSVGRGRITLIRRPSWYRRPMSTQDDWRPAEDVEHFGGQRLAGGGSEASRRRERSDLV
ncbi:hypothetical protein PR048_028717 [Dryococelus australis]|uniref:Uncharacterized protein n=1 Tax=Dryococelus australis TaxID=614101 RepID=A0ABQ9GBC7_9NEOP|nr:hypothetical protein PR048_028717 [Dryococelus australis]